MRSSSLKSIPRVASSPSLTRGALAISLGLLAGCTVRVPKNLGIPVAVSTHIAVKAQVNASVTLVPLQGAQVAEFFGVPLDGAQDVVFVLDVSGSMSEVATGRAATLGQADVAPPPTLPPGPPPGPPPYGPPGPPGPPPSGPPPAPYTDPSVPQDSQRASNQYGQPNDPYGQQPAPPAVISTTKIHVAQAELVDALKRLPSGTRMDIVFFNDTVEAFAPTFVSLDDPTRDGLINYVNATGATGSTALSDAMRVAMLMNPQRIVLLSDGLGNVGGDSDSILRDAREAIRGGVRIDTIGLGAGQDASLLGALSRESGGLYQQL